MLTEGGSLHGNQYAKGYKTQSSITVSEKSVISKYSKPVIESSPQLHVLIEFLQPKSFSFSPKISTDPSNPALYANYETSHYEIFSVISLLLDP
jgi:hypothetical protein